jgi:histidine ammonia-lyase
VTEAGTRSRPVGTGRSIALGAALRVEDLVAVADGEDVPYLPPDVAERMRASAARTRSAVLRGSEVYGITSGVGDLRVVDVEAGDVEEIQRDIVLSHACATGPPLPGRVVRAAMCSRANVFSRGHSSVRPEVVELLLALLRHGVTPVVPSAGSVGASGDPVLLAHIGQVLLGHGEVELPGGARAAAADALTSIGCMPLRPQLREGLALGNGLDFSIGRAALAIHAAGSAFRRLDRVAALTFDALGARTEVLDPRVLALRGPGGHDVVGARLREWLEGRGVPVHGDDVGPQDPYCLRCAPQVHGAAADVLERTRAVVTGELGAVVDNPLTVDDGPPLHCGHFHGQALAMASDVLRISTATLANIAQARISLLLRGERGLPRVLADAADGRSGLMMLETSSASLVARVRAAAAPLSVHSIAVSSDQEDHTSMSWESVAATERCVEDLDVLSAIEARCAAEAIRLGDRSPSPGNADLAARIVACDGPLARQVEDVRLLLREVVA